MYCFMPTNSSLFQSSLAKTQNKPNRTCRTEMHNRDWWEIQLAKKVKKVIYVADFLPKPTALSLTFLWFVLATNLKAFMY